MLYVIVLILHKTKCRARFFCSHVRPKGIRVGVLHMVLVTGTSSGDAPLELQSRFRRMLLRFQVVCLQNGTAVLTGLTKPCWNDPAIVGTKHLE